MKTYWFRIFSGKCWFLGQSIRFQYLVVNIIVVPHFASFTKKFTCYSFIAFREFDRQLLWGYWNRGLNNFFKKHILVFLCAVAKQFFVYEYIHHLFILKCTKIVRNFHFRVKMYYSKLSTFALNFLGYIIEKIEDPIFVRLIIF